VALRDEVAIPEEMTAEPLPEPFAEGNLRLGMAGDGGLRWAAADLTEVIESARARLDLSPVAAAALGRCLAGSALLLRLSAKTPTRLVVEVRGDGPLGRVIAEADDAGNLRGMVGDPRAEVAHTAEGKLAVGRAVGRGRMRVLREHPDGGSYQSQVELISGEIAEDLSHYLDQSQQIRSAVLLGVLARPHGVAAGGGLIVEVLPGASPAALDRLEANLAGAGGVSRLLDEGGLERAVEVVLAGLDPRELERRPLYHRCRCSRDRLGRHLAQLAEEDLAPLRLDDGSVEGECVFCASTYRFSADELGLPAAN
jgi:molecular chaperone Hsp33